MAGILTTEQLARTQTNPQDDVQSTALSGQIAPRLQNLGDHKFPVTTNSARAQLFINQAMMLVYGFNHAEATRSFREAARLDPNCAMAYWGMALVLGPNINMAMSPEAEPQAYELIQKAIVLRKNASEKEQAYIDALAVRYTGAEKPNRTVADRIYAEAMLEFHKRYPNDLDAATLYAEAVMDLRPWNYWTRDKQPYPETREVLRVLESVLERNPNHPGAIHLYIHAVEYARPEIAEAEAEAIYWQDIEQNRENGWSLFGLMLSLRAQGKEEQAVVIENRFRKAWKGADVTLTASRFMGDAHVTMAAAGAAVSGN